MKRSSVWLRVALPLLASAVLVLPTGCGPDVPQGEAACTALHLDRKPGRIPVILVINDAMRRDRVGVYGGRAETPVFDRFARENLLFDAAFAQAPWTIPSVTTLFTSLYPSQHGMQTDSNSPRKAFVLPDTLTTLAEVFRSAGYKTAAFVSNPWMEKRFGFAQGFETYEESESWSHDGTALSEAALAWLRDVPEGEPYLLYLHYIDSHRPYPALELDELRAQAERIRSDQRPVSEPERREIAAVMSIKDAGLTGLLIERRIAVLEIAYEKGIANFDRAFGQFLAGFDETWAARDAAMIVTSDHGESLFDRGFGNHGQSLHDDEIAIPLAARLPGVRASVEPIPCQVGLIDVLPTLCEYLDLPCAQPLFGRSWFGTSGDRRWLAAEGVGGQPRHRTIRNREWKLMWEPGRPPDGPLANPSRLYRIDADPGERTDLANSEAADARRSFEVLEPALRNAVPPFERPAGNTAPIDPALEERLRGLGYLDEDHPER
jgi:arylsulfatase